MASATERLKIFENIIARVGLDGDVLGEYSKAMSMINGMQTYNELNPPQNMASVAPQTALNDTQLPPMGQSTTQGEIMPENAQNTPPGM
jgi:hypothetical protein